MTWLAARTWRFWAVAIPLLYVGSIGPAARLFKDGIVDNRIAPLFYPIVWLGDHSPAFSRIIESYVGLCGGFDERD